jgi:hypothetical protein
VPARALAKHFWTASLPVQICAGAAEAVPERHSTKAAARAVKKDFNMIVFLSKKWGSPVDDCVQRTNIKLFNLAEEKF